jgi:hypothetical protein
MVMASCLLWRSLPLISYGGTSMVTLLAGFGILMSIHTHKNSYPTNETKTALAHITLGCACLILTACADTEIKTSARTCSERPFPTPCRQRNDAINTFIRKMVEAHRFDERLHALFDSVEIKNDILKESRRHQACLV